MTEKTEQRGATAAPGTIAIDPGVALIEHQLFAQAKEAHLMNRALVNAQQASERAKAINTVQEATGKVIAENKELRARIAELEKQIPIKAAKKEKVNG